MPALLAVLGKLASAVLLVLSTGNSATRQPLFQPYDRKCWSCCIVLEQETESLQKCYEPEAFGLASNEMNFLYEGSVSFLSLSETITLSRC